MEVHKSLMCVSKLMPLRARASPEQLEMDGRWLVTLVEHARELGVFHVSKTPRRLACPNPSHFGRRPSLLDSQNDQVLGHARCLGMFDT